PTGQEPIHEPSSWTRTCLTLLDSDRGSRYSGTSPLGGSGLLHLTRGTSQDDGSREKTQDEPIQNRRNPDDPDVPLDGPGPRGPGLRRADPRPEAGGRCPLGAPSR